MEILLSIMDLRSLSSSGVHRLLVFLGTAAISPSRSGPGEYFAGSPNIPEQRPSLWDRSVCSFNQFTKRPRGKSTFVLNVEQHAARAQNSHRRRYGAAARGHLIPDPQSLLVDLA